MKKIFQRLYDRSRIQPPVFTDAVIALQLAASDKYDPDMDVNGDSVVTSLDALMILQAAREMFIADMSQI